MMQEIGKIKFQRAVVPEDAINLDIPTIDAADASQKLACVTIYARFLKKDGTHSCQLIFSRSKLIPDGLSQPRAELFAATTNAHTGEIVRRALQENHKGKMKLTDSQVVLHWLSNHEKAVKQWVRNRVIEILRFTDSSEWFFISSHNMIADLGTRRVDDLRLVDQNSTWINGFDWMRKDNKEFPIKSLDQIRLSREELAATQIENVLEHNLDVTDIQSSDENNVYMAHKQQLYYNESINVYQQKIIPHEVTECYKFSSYLLDPNKHRFRTVVRIMAFVLKFIKLVKTKSPQKFQNNDVNSITLSDEEILAAKEYFFRKATLEVKRFIKPTQYQKISIERDGILYYSGRILPTDNIKITGEMSTVMKDLAADTFCVPIIYKHSPLAYSLINEVHWHSKAPMHSGVETGWRYVLKTGFIIFERDLVKKIKTQCQRYSIE